MSRILLTGATGFVGGRTALRLLHAGHEVLCPVRRTSDVLARAGAVQLDGGLDAVTADALTGVEVVVHAAATVGPDLETGVEVNVEGTRRVLAACGSAGAPSLVHVSTTSVYDRPQHGDEPVTEATPLVAMTSQDAGVYARTKAEAERVLIDEHTGVTTVAILRPPAVLGAGPTSTWGQRIPDRIRTGEPVPLQRGSTFAYVHVDDLVDAILAAAGLEVEADDGAADRAGAATATPRSARPAAPAGDDATAPRIANVVGGHVTVADYLDAVVDLLPERPPSQPGRDETGWTGRFSSTELPRLFGVAPYRSFATGMAEIANALTGTSTEQEDPA